MGLRFTQIALSMNMDVPLESLERHLAASPPVVAEELARQVMDYEKQHHLGYYPAIEFFLHNGGVEPELLDALQNITWVVTNLVRNEVRIKLRPVFSQVKFESIQSRAYTLSGIRPGENNSLRKLIEHFSATSVKVSLIATLIQKFHDRQAAENMAKMLCNRWLEPHFEQFTVTSSTVL